MNPVRSAIVSMIASAAFCVLQLHMAGAQAAKGSAKVDATIRTAWQREGITPSTPTDDVQFLRRIYLDIIGTIPPPQVVSDYISDTSKDKRSAAVDALLSDPRYIDHWTNYWDDILMGKQMFSQVVDRSEFRAWLHAEIAKNTPWNQLVTKLITATGQNSTGPTYSEANAPGAMSREAADINSGQQGVDRSQINGAVNWQLKYAQSPADLSGLASKIFLGVQIQCAQCHDHKTEKWKQADFKSFTACFTQAIPIPTGTFAQILQMSRAEQQKVTMNKVREVELRDVAIAVQPNQLNGGPDRAMYQQVPPAALDGTSFAGAPAARRRNLAAWMTADSNEWFAKAYVNRLWSRFLGRGFVEPIDDLRPSNPAVIPDALDALADQFKASGYDTRQLIRTICATQAYQLSSGQADKQDRENKYFDRFRLKPIETEALLNSLVAATNFQTVLAKMPGGASLEQIKARLQRQLTFVFSTDEEESEQKVFEGTIPQALLLLNGNLTNNGVLPRPGTTLAEVMAMPRDSDRIESLYLRTLSRKPSAAESQRWIEYVNAPREAATTIPSASTAASIRPGANAAQQQGPRQQGQAEPASSAGGRMPARVAASRENPKLQAYEDVLWALLNSSEFAFNH